MGSPRLHGVSSGPLSFLVAATNICVWSSEGSLVDTVDVELDRLISKRASQDRNPDRDEVEPGYVESVRRFNAHRREEMRAAWCEHHQGQASRLRAVLEELIANHEEQAERYRDQQEGAA
jgi:type II secretory ATPase GspE/PulE/Tfp pilus assembly ATPase PilB-like protein